VLLLSLSLALSCTLSLLNKTKHQHNKELVEARGRVTKANEEARKLRVALHRELGLAEGEAIPDKVLEEEQGGLVKWI
jgi:hypothetical protein